MQESIAWDRHLAAFRESGSRARAVLDDHSVRDAWLDDSILRGMTVGAVADHLLAVVLTFERRCNLPIPPDAAHVEPVSRYGVVRLDRASDLADPRFRVVRDGAERLAARGHAAVVQDYTASLDRLDNRLRDESPDRPIQLPDGSTTSLRAYTVTRLVELVVHADDLAESVGTAIPPPGDAAAELVIRFLVSAVRHRLGDARTVRALAGRANSDQLRAL